MLVLTRKPNEGIFIGDNIFIKVTAVNGNQVKIAIDAPDDVKILREELVNQNEGGSDGKGDK